jgi:predicted metal-dependent TIM-barrel fold hydrolase
MVADRDVMVSFAHATHEEIFAMAEEVRSLGITKAVIDHPFSPFIDLSLEQMKELASAGVYLNFTYDEISPLLGVNPADMCRTIQALGTDHVTLSSDAGEPLFPHTVEALRLLRAHMNAFGLTEEEVHQVSSVNPGRLLDIT